MFYIYLFLINFYLYFHLFMKLNMKTVRIIVLNFLNYIYYIQFLSLIIFIILLPAWYSHQYSDVHLEPKTSHICWLKNSSRRSGPELSFIHFLPRQPHLISDVLRRDWDPIFSRPTFPPASLLYLLRLTWDMTGGRRWKIQFLCCRVSLTLPDRLEPASQGHNRPLRARKYLAGGAAGQH